MSKKVLILQLLSTPGLGNRIIKKILDSTEKAEEIYEASPGKLKNITGLSDNKIKKIQQALKDREAGKIKLKKIKDKGYKIYIYTGSDYPVMLSKIYDPPVVLFSKGKLLPEDFNSVAVVGTRRCTEYGKRAAEKISRYLVQKNITVISGCALGIDSVAHRASLDGGGRTVAVLGGGLDKPYPKQNKGLMDKIADNGAVVTEYPPDTPPKKHNFPQRNRIISGLSLGVVVAQAPSRSGALITAYQALEQNREVFSVPGNIFTKKCKGTNKLIKEGAHPVTAPEDIVDGLEFILDKKLLSHREKKNLENNFSGEAKEILKIVGEEPVHIDRLKRLTKMSTKKLMTELTRLELQGKIEQLSLKRYVRK
ncbi:MAG: DNA-processing protein DprA [Elusimicrobiota bacterium]